MKRSCPRGREEKSRPKRWYEGGSVGFVEQDSEVIGNWQAMRSGAFWEERARGAKTVAEVQSEKSGGASGDSDVHGDETSGGGSRQAAEDEEDKSGATPADKVQGGRSPPDLEEVDRAVGGSEAGIFIPAAEYSRICAALSIVSTLQEEVKQLHRAQEKSSAKMEKICSKMEENCAIMEERMGEKIEGSVHASVRMMEASLSKEIKVAIQALREDPPSTSTASSPVVASLNEGSVAIWSGGTRRRRRPVRGKPRCEICGVDFGNPSAKCIHMQRVHEGRSWKCQFCGVEYGSPSARATHIKSTHPDLYHPRIRSK